MSQQESPLKGVHVDPCCGRRKCTFLGQVCRHAHQKRLRTMVYIYDHLTWKALSPTEWSVLTEKERPELRKAAQIHISLLFSSFARILSFQHSLAETCFVTILNNYRDHRLMWLLYILLCTRIKDH